MEVRPGCTVEGDIMRKFTKVLAAALAAVTSVSLAACGSGSSDAVDENAPVTITWWGWGTSAEKQAKDFMKKYPNITVKFQNIGSASKQYVSLNNAISANSGMPDVAMLEYFALPQFVSTGKVLDLKQYGADKYESDYAPGPWASVALNGGVYGLPVDSGPMAWFYNKAVFDKAGVDATQVKTWDQFYEAAKKIRATGSYITSDSGDATSGGFYDSMVWQAGGHPFKTSKDGKTVSINLTGDEGAKKFTKFWQKLIAEDLIDTKTVSWSDEWNKALGDGSIASLLTGAWMPVNLENGSPAASGNYRVTQMPQWNEGDHANSENGGTCLSLMDTGDKAKEAASYKLVDYLNHSKEGTDRAYELGVFPSINRILQSDEFLNKTSDYFGGQKINEELMTASKNVLTGWEFLPFEVQARTTFPDTAGKAYAGGTTLEKGVSAWQDSLVKFAKDQGFTVKE